MTWEALGESVPGSAHRARGRPCQDAFRFARTGDWLVVAVADGAGSAARAEVGAELACDTFAELAAAAPADLLTRDAMLAAFARVRDRLAAEAGRLGVAPRDLACTALAAVVGPDAGAFAQVGDGAIVAGAADDLRVVFWPDPGGYANKTDFLTDDRFADRLRYEVTAAPMRRLAVLTDGLQRVALDYAARAPHRGFFGPLFDRLAAAADPEPLVDPFRAFLDSPRMNERTDDDKTLVVAVRRP